MTASTCPVRELTLDGQPFVVPGDSTWDDIIASGSWGGLPVFYSNTKPIIVEMLRFVREHAEAFSLGLCKHGPFAKTWTAMTLFQGTQPRRVHIERVRCGACGAMQTIANPVVADLFLGVDANNEAFARAFHAERVQCARCTGELPRPAVWTELASTE